MMKIVVWSRDSAPEIEFDDNGDILIEDSRLEHNLEVGDQVQYVSFEQGVGTRCFFVMDRSPLDEEYSIRRLVTLSE
jgi:hypothetical protein